MTTLKMTDDQLVNGCMNNHAGSQKLLFEKYSKKMMGVCLRYVPDYDEAQDVLQESFIKVFQKINSYKPAVGIDIIFFDAEDYGQPDFSTLPKQDDTYCLGSQYWARNPHVPGYFASFGVLLDMVASEKATFTKEGTSMQYASSIVNKIWEHASRIGFSDYFLFKETPGIIDDHYYINQLIHIPVIDIVHRDPGTSSNFWKYWHTHGDTMDKISKLSLKAVGQTVLETIFREGTPG